MAAMTGDPERSDGRKRISSSATRTGLRDSRIWHTSVSPWRRTGAPIPLLPGRRSTAARMQTPCAGKKENKNENPKKARKSDRFDFSSFSVFSFSTLCLAFIFMPCISNSPDVMRTGNQTHPLSTVNQDGKVMQQRRRLRRSQQRQRRR